MLVLDDSMVSEIAQTATMSMRCFTCAPITRTTRGIRSEVSFGPEQGLPESCVIGIDNIVTVPVDALVGRPVGNWMKSCAG